MNPSTPRLSHTRTGILQLLVGSFLISFSAVFVNISHVGPTIAGVYRNFFGAVFLFLLVMVQGNGLAGYLKDWRETRIVVELSESAATKLGAAREQLEGQVQRRDG